MIIGTGNDMVEITRIAGALDKYGERFLARLFTATERAKAERRAGGIHGMAPTLAKRFAAKEAGAKALGTGFAGGVYWRDIGVINLHSGQPTLHFTGGAAARLAELTPPGYMAVVHLALTDDYPWALANVTIEALPL